MAVSRVLIQQAQTYKRQSLPTVTTIFSGKLGQNITTTTSPPTFASRHYYSQRSSTPPSTNSSSPPPSSSNSSAPQYTSPPTATSTPFEFIAPEPRTWSTELAKHLASAMAITGPIPLASYMRMCLTGDLGGYYTGGLDKEQRDPFGARGDFVTSPEISQIFGELVGIWFVAEWMSQGRPTSGVQLMEVGPGRGTLMDDILRTIQRFPALANAIEAVYLVEAGESLQQQQKDRLCGPASEFQKTETGYKSISKYSKIPIIWEYTTKSIPKDESKIPFIVAHEFFDALPIHAFQTVEVPQAQRDPNTAQTPTQTSSQSRYSEAPHIQWRELVVAPTPEGATHESINTPKSLRHGPVPDFQLTVSDSPTRHSRYLPDSIERISKLRTSSANNNASVGGGGTVVEVCPDLSIYASDFAERIGNKARPSGAALILDYGTLASVPASTLRGIHRHQLVSPFALPGMVDVSADVDFVALAEAAMAASSGVEVHGPVLQAHFLRQMGIAERAQQLIRKVKASNQETSGTEQEADPMVKSIEQSWKRLVDLGPNGMGRTYKALAILPENSGRRRPVGFGGDV